VSDLDATVRSSVAVYVCTYQRNELLTECLEAIKIAADAASELVDVGVVIADDNVDGRAIEVVRRFEGQFPLGIQHIHVGSGNISTARNAGMGGAMVLADWVAMTDDDDVPDPQWIVQLVRCQRAFDADCVMGHVELRAPKGSPAWLIDQPFMETGASSADDGAELDTASTNNSMIRSQFLRDRPTLRFDPALGRLGGEDQVFFRSAVGQGMTVRFAQLAVVYSNEELSRTSYRYRLRMHLWVGNTEAVTNLRTRRASRPRLVVRGLRRMGEAIARSANRTIHGKSPQLRFLLARITLGVGLVLGASGIEIDHH
jgi:succinoglycan biosynthesis protein ExoM